VAVIISLLTALLLPALTKAKQQAWATVCKNNLRQIGIAAYLYADAWNCYLPRGTASTGKTWFELFLPYLSHPPADNDYRDVKIYRCPAYPDKEQTVCFVNNAWQFDGPEDTQGSPVEKPTSILGLSRLDGTIYMADNEYGCGREIIKIKNGPGWHTCDVWSTDHLPKITNLQRRVARSRHSKGSAKPGCNVLYLDWHADRVGADDMTPDMWRFR